MSRFREALASTLLLAIPAAAAPPAAPPPQFVGRYHQGSVDSSEDLLILPDQIFCIGVMAGELDLLIAGRWTRNGDTIQLDEVKAQQSPLFVAWIVSDRAEDKGKIAFEFDGHSLGRQGGFVFGTSASDATPSDFRPLFAPGANGFDSLYTERRPAGPKSFALGFRDGEASDDDPYRIVQYRLPAIPPGAGLRVRAGYDREAARPALHVQGTVTGSGLAMDGRSPSHPRPITDGDAATCRNQLRQMETPPAPESDAGGGHRLQPFRESVAALRLPARPQALFKTSYDNPAPSP